MRALFDKVQFRHCFDFVIIKSLFSLSVTQYNCQIKCESIFVTLLRSKDPTVRSWRIFSDPKQSERVTLTWVAFILHTFRLILTYFYKYASVQVEKYRPVLVEKHRNVEVVFQLRIFRIFFDDIRLIPTEKHAKWLEFIGRKKNISGWNTVFTFRSLPVLFTALSCGIRRLYSSTWLYKFHRSYAHEGREQIILPTL